MDEPPFDSVPRRIIPALPDEDPRVGALLWKPWEKALTLSHYDGSCETCAYPGPMNVCQGLSRREPEERLVRVERSSRTEGKPSRWVKALVGKAGWKITHWAVRCPACDEMRVWHMEGGITGRWRLLHHHPCTTAPVVPPRGGTAP